MREAFNGSRYSLIILPILIIGIFFPLIGEAQETQAASGYKLNAGISALPVFDALGLYPDNQIKGSAVTANFGCFIHPRISFGINPYFAKVANSYPTSSVTALGERQDMTVFGLNSYLRFYIFSRSRLSVFMLGSAGIGAMREQYTDLTVAGSTTPIHTQSLPVATIFAGMGVSWNFTSWMAAEVNLPYAMIYKLNVAQGAHYFSTVLPTIGLQFFWKNK